MDTLSRDTAVPLFPFFPPSVHKPQVLSVVQEAMSEHGRAETQRATLQVVKGELGKTVA